MGRIRALIPIGGEAMEHNRNQAVISPSGGKANFRKISVTLPPGDYEKLIQESARRKIARDRNPLISALLREAVMDYLKRIGEQPQAEGGYPPAALSK
jgi:hypothetical protein